MQKVFAVDEIVWQICEYLPNYCDVDNFLSTIGFNVPQNNKNWFNLLFKRIQYDWDEGWDKITTKLMVAIQATKRHYWCYGVYPERRLHHEMSVIFEDLLQFNNTCNKGIAKIFRGMDEEVQKKRQTSILVINMKIAPLVNMCQQKLQICIHLTQLFNWFHRRTSTFTIAADQYFHSSINCQVVCARRAQANITTLAVSPHFPFEYSLHVSGSCSFCYNRLLYHDLGFSFRVEYSGRGFAKISTQSDVDALKRDLDLEI